MLDEPRCQLYRAVVVEGDTAGPKVLIDFRRSAVPRSGGHLQAPLVCLPWSVIPEAWPPMSVLLEETTVKKGLLWQQWDRFFSRWKERFFLLTQDYLVCFKKGSKVGISEMGTFLYKVASVENLKYDFNAFAFVIKTGSTTQWQADLAPKEMAASDMRNRRHPVIPLVHEACRTMLANRSLHHDDEGQQPETRTGDFDTRDKERGGRPIKFEDAELEALLDEDSSQTQEELAETLGVTQQAISNRLMVMGMVQKQGNWVPYELKPGNIERRICTCELLLKRQNRKGFLHRIVTGDEKWIHYDNPKRRKSSVKPGHASTSTAKPNIHGKKLMLCIWWDQLGVIYYELLKPNETITGERYQQQLMRLSRALKIKRPLCAKRHDKETLEALQWDVLPHPLYSPDIASSDYHMFRSMTHGLAEQHFTSYEEAKKNESSLGDSIPCFINDLKAVDNVEMILPKLSESKVRLNDVEGLQWADKKRDGVIALRTREGQQLLLWTARGLDDWMYALRDAVTQSKGRREALRKSSTLGSAHLFGTGERPRGSLESLRSVLDRHSASTPRNVQRASGTSSSVPSCECAAAEPKDDLHGSQTSLSSLSHLQRPRTVSPSRDSAPRSLSTHVLLGPRPSSIYGLLTVDKGRLAYQHHHRRPGVELATAPR
ncbi:SETMAR [Cordylochernes scorpioides]|uniref:SETMAR n=1 Tax=Cordylochernes scorpioides TaxID=51811 RepID=A0ABY6LKP4_9ARAC|nr:SETMAR [Cordylochernes scorpioides]